MKSKNYYEEIDNLIINIIKENFCYIKIVRSDINFENRLIYYCIIFNNFSVGFIINFSDIEMLVDNEEIEQFIIGSLQKEILKNFMKG